jgi:hypothetical protein
VPPAPRPRCFSGSNAPASSAFSLPSRGHAETPGGGSNSCVAALLRGQNLRRSPPACAYLVCPRTACMRACAPAGAAPCLGAPRTLSSCPLPSSQRRVAQCSVNRTPRPRAALCAAALLLGPSKRGLFREIVRGKNCPRAQYSENNSGSATRATIHKRIDVCERPRRELLYTPIRL